ncbi:uncharacterized protein LOC107366904 [Tetranychus urticae]|uniref:Uncharacterized protein n=1 Tax=Tetranychus urticae TaxID=32264 RepID=T1KSZ6_TETUR|nr:uncharacterized protein LOC107366904 [Tetranychus urticae]
MLSKTLLVCSLILGSVICYSNAVEETDFLNAVVDKYSPALVKQLIIKRIQHKREQLTKLSSSVGLTRDQINLCQVTYQAFATLEVDVKLMDQHEVICGDDTYQKAIKYFINQFTYLNEMFEYEFEVLKHPVLTKYNPDILLESLTQANIDKIRQQAIELITAFAADIDEIVADKKTSNELKALGQGISNELKDMVIEMKSSYPVQKLQLLKNQITSFQQLIDIFYRQLELLSGKSFIDQSTELNTTPAYKIEDPVPTKINPELLLESLTQDNIDTIKEQTIKSIEAFTTDIAKIADETTSGEINYLGADILTELRDMVNVMRAWTPHEQTLQALESKITSFQEFIDIFYRALEAVTKVKRFY